MTATFASAEWAAQLASTLDQHARVRTESVTWIHGPLLLVVDADEDHGQEATALRLDVHEGSVRGVEAVGVDAAARTPFVVGGGLARWKSVFGGELSLVDGILDSKLRMTGDLPTVVRHRAMFDAIAAAGGELATSWPHEREAETANA